jgi:hypothetical protein
MYQFSNKDDSEFSETAEDMKDVVFNSVYRPAYTPRYVANHSHSEKKIWLFNTPDKERYNR